MHFNILIFLIYNPWKQVGYIQKNKKIKEYLRQGVRQSPKTLKSKPKELKDWFSIISHLVINTLVKRQNQSGRASLAILAG